MALRFKEQHQPSDRISLRPGSAKRTYTTNRGGASSENCPRIFVPFPWEAEGTAGGCRKFICGRPRLHHPRFLSLLAPSQGLCVFLIHLVLVFFFSSCPRGNISTARQGASWDSGLEELGRRPTAGWWDPVLTCLMFCSSQTFFALTSEYYLN